MSKPSNFTLVVPDIHERVEQLAKIDAIYPAEVPRVYLGDWFDAFQPNTKDTVLYLAEELKRPSRTFLLGNHDFQYLDSRGRCSGYKESTAALIEEHLPKDWGDHFQIAGRCHGWLLSHAGFNKPPEEWDDEAAKLAVGRARGGYSTTGGPLWLDWNYEFKGIKDTPQIVGHTYGKNPRIINGSVNLDCGLKFVAEIRWNGELVIVPVD